MSRAAAEPSTKWTSLDDACRAPGWTEAKIRKWIEDGRLPWRGYSQEREEDVTSNNFKPDFRISRVDRGSTMHVFWSNVDSDPIEGVDSDTVKGADSDTIEGVEVQLPDRASTTAQPPAKRKLVRPHGKTERWVFDEMESNPPQKGDREYVRNLHERCLSLFPGKTQKTIGNYVGKYRKGFERP